MAKQRFTVDLNKPLVFQVGHLGDAYQEWVHQPIVCIEGPRFFENSIFEKLTRTAWWVIPIVWLPFAYYLIMKSIWLGHTPSQVALLMIAGIFVWTLLEYLLHRFLFHIQTGSYWGNTLHYLMHGFHHKHPMDRLRLVYPPVATAIILSPIWHLCKLISTPTAHPSFIAGGLLGYVMYDLTHYYLHHGHPSHEFLKYMKKYHLSHHFRIQNRGFGITSTVWDKIFGTLPATKSTNQES